jgi:glycosyltransferase involved in cell wall biosynthesis
MATAPAQSLVASLRTDAVVTGHDLHTTLLNPLNQCDVSVVIGAYNGEQLIAETLDNVLSQQGVTLECIVVDDGSTDRTAEILEQRARNDERLRFVRREENRGLTASLIEGCALARGQYIARQDVGDLSIPGRFAKQYAALAQNPSVSFVSCWTEFIGPDLEFLYTVKGTGAAAKPRAILASSAPHGTIDGPTSHGSVMFVRDAYERAGGYRPEFYFGQDWDLWYRLAALGDFLMLEEPLFQARLMPASLSATARDRQTSIGGISLECLRRRTQNRSEDDLLQRAAAVRPEQTTRSRAAAKVSEAQWLYFIAECLRRNRDPRARKYFGRALAIRPASLRTWIRLAQSLISDRGVDHVPARA